MNTVDFLENSLARILELIRAADSKVPFILAVDTSLLALFGALSTGISDWSFRLVILLIISVAPLLLSLYFTFIAAIPRTHGPKDSMIFFGSIAQRDIQSYLEDIRNLTEEDYISDLASQCHRNAQIANTKFRFVKLATGSLFVGIFLSLILVPFLVMYRGN